MTENATQTIAITGGTGSFGHAVTRHLLKRSDIRKIHIISRDEAKQEAMRLQLNDPRLHFWIADVRDPRSLEPALRQVDAVFHAAALKQVPSCEFFPEQAVMTNVLGSLNILESAARLGVQKVVCLSTDKAVEPVNAMGMTKALMEKQVQALARRFGSVGPTVSCVRYGNVLYSRGSVVPLFVDRLLAGQPLPITHPEMTRFLLPLSEAVGLVELALRQGQQGDLFIRKSPAANVKTVVEGLESLFGRKVEREHIGIRHGEKMHETLATSEEMARAIDLGDHWRIPMDHRELNYAPHQELATGPVAKTPPFVSDKTEQLDPEGVARLLASLPEFAPLLPQCTR